MSRGWRSLLFVPCDDQVRLAKIADRGADAVILDLEDSIPSERKPQARAGLPTIIRTLAERHCPLVIRVNTSWRDIYADLEVAVQPGVDAIMVPKVEAAPTLAIITEMLSEIASFRGLEVVPGLIPLIESPAGLAEVYEIARIPSVIGLALGSEDFSLALGVPPSPVALDLPCRLVALAAARYDRLALGLPVSITTIDDEAAWRAGIQAGRSVGMTGALCIHPRQVAAANQGFSPDAAEVETAQRILDAWVANGESGVTRLDGKMIDLPVVLAAKRLLLSSRIGVTSP
ncbi:CoA ester lyase [Sphingomonas sp. DBB INV C78]|uniref:HpcH/HpaI aldolase/citrate lyase family protein n=1 Tax=Sphingomonas sp. DBB INV C78 TaxID=3349434 RepID=UPI0036D20C60